MSPAILKKMTGAIMITIGMTFFLLEHKAIPHNPKNPEKWDALHKKFIRPIKMSARIFLLLGLTFLLT
jgi:hypothetical protein